MSILFGSRALQVLDFWAKKKSIEKVILADNCCEDLINWAVKNINEVVILDIDIFTKEMSFDKLTYLVENNKIGEKLLVLWVWPYGLKPSLKKLEKIKNSGDCLLLEDRCLARPVLPDENQDYEISDSFLYSTGYSKYCDLSFGGWLEDKKSPEINISNSISKKEYYSAVKKRRKIIDEHKKFINERLDQITKNIKLNKWNPNTWRYCFETYNPDLYTKYIFQNNAFSSKHYNSKKFIKPHSKPNTFEHKKHVVNLFNDLRVNNEYLDKVEMATIQYKDALYNSL